MTLPAPESAPPRPDLAFLRRRARPATDPGGHPSPVESRRSPTAAPAQAASASLDLSGSAAPPVPGLPEPGRKVLPALPVRRVHPGRPEVLTPKAPTLTLNRLQSGIGPLVIEAACSAAVGDLRLGCAYLLGSGVTSVVQHHSGIVTAPSGSTRPILSAKRGRFETITVDLVQVRDLDRLLLYGFSASGGTLSWGGTLVTTTFGGARVEVPMDGPAAAGVVVLGSVYNVDGELVLRAEAREVSPTVREACLAFGFDRITWLDPQTPAT